MIIEILEFYTGDIIAAMSLVKTSFWFESSKSEAAKKSPNRNPAFATLNTKLLN